MALMLAYEAGTVYAGAQRARRFKRAHIENARVIRPRPCQAVVGREKPPARVGAYVAGKNVWNHPRRLPCCPNNVRQALKAQKRR